VPACRNNRYGDLGELPKAADQIRLALPIKLADVDLAPTWHIQQAVFCDPDEAIREWGRESRPISGGGSPCDDG